MASRTPTLLIALVFAAVLSLSACSSTKNAADKAYKEKSVAQLYNVAVDALEKGNYESASLKFDEVERQHPYSNWAVKSQIMSAYSLYMANQYDAAVVALDRFIELHPSNKDTDYAYYLKALSYYEQISDVGRDQKMTQLALKTLKELVKRFPKSNYSRDAKLKIDLTNDHLAGKEMAIGRYYQSRGQWLAAINRFDRVVKVYQTTTHTPEALERLTESYLALGLRAEAQKTAAVLGQNFPSSHWYVDAYRLLKDPNFRMSKAKPWYKIW